MSGCRSLFSIFLLVLLISATGCQRQDIIVPAEKRINAPENGPIATARQGTDTCYTTACIEDWFAGWSTFSSEPELVIWSNDDPYNLGGHHIVTTGNDALHVAIRGNDPDNRPTLHLASCFYYRQYGYDYHATLHFAGPAQSATFVSLKDLIIKHDCYMESGDLPGIQFEVHNVELENVKLTNSEGYSATTHFMAPGLVTIDDCELSTGHRLSFGPSNWCGGDCGGFGDPPPADGSEITNSKLYGDIYFDVTQGSPPAAVEYYVRNNNPLTRLYLKSNEGSLLKVILEDNTFASQQGARVEIVGGFTVDASGNATSKGPCSSDARADFDLTQADLGDSALTLTSWKYNGVVYCPPVIQELAASRNGNTVYVEWSTECGATSVVKWGTSCGSLSNTVTESDAQLHEVSFGVPSNEGCIYLKAISAIPGCSCEADTSECTAVVKDIVISNIQTSFNSLLCQFTVTWTTNVKSSSKVYFGSSCSSLSHTATGSNNITSHSVVCDVSGVSGAAFAYKVESSNACDSEQSSCTTIRKDKCIGQ